MRALNRRLSRELWRLRGQVLAVALVIGSGVAVLVMALSTFEALSETSEAYYERYQFADVFAGAKRVPISVARRIAAISGVQLVQTRIARYATLDVQGFAEPVIGRLTSIPETGQPVLNQLALRSGRWIQPGRHDETIISEPFAEAHALEAGDTFTAIVNGRKRRLTVVGTALSPEFIYALGPGALLPDDKRFGIVWMGREALEAAYDLDNSFNDLAVTLLRDVAPEPVISEIDTLLEPYGGVSAIPRADQLSNWFVRNELSQQQSMSTILPTIFLGVAAFLCYTVLSRLITTERSEIGLLKAFGYSDLVVGWYYAKLVIAISLIGAAIGWILGGYFGRLNTQMYADTFRFPLLIYRPSAEAFLIAGSVSLIATLSGALVAVRRVVKLPPAEAMRPPAPPTYRHGVLAHPGLRSWLDQPTRIALRQIGRWPLRAAVTTIGIAASVGLLIMALQWEDAIDYIADKYFFQSQHQTLSIGLTDPQSLATVREMKHLPGVMAAEPWRAVPADLSAGTRRHRGGVIGLARSNRLQPIYDDATDTRIAVPEGGIVLSRYLAEKLGVGVSDYVRVHVLEGRRPEGELRVVAVFETTIAMPAYMDLDALNRWLGERPVAQYVNVLVDASQQAALFSRLKQTPRVSAIMVREGALEAFHDTVGHNILIFIGIFTGFAMALAFGVTYNSARIALSERGRELATLRVLGFTRGEISYVLLGEVAVLIFLALPLGCLIGYWLALVVARTFDSELFRMPLSISPSSYGFGVIVALTATVLSALLVRRRIARLDLIRVLKTRE